MHSLAHLTYFNKANLDSKMITSHYIKCKVITKTLKTIRGLYEMELLGAESILHEELKTYMYFNIRNTQ